MDGNNHIGIDRPSMVKIVLRGNAGIFRMRVIEADHIQLPLPRMTFAAQQLPRLDEKATSPGFFFTGVGNREELNQGFASILLEMAQQEPAAFVGIFIFTQAANLIDMLLPHTDHFLFAPTAWVVLPRCFSTAASA